MAKIVLIGCTKRKRPNGKEYIARELYDAPKSSFPLKYQYAKSQEPDKIIILSAKYHVMDTKDEATKYKPYNTTLAYIAPKKRTPDLKILDRQEKIEWAKTVLKQLNALCNLSNDEFLLVLGKPYYENLILETQCDEVKMIKLYIHKYKFPVEKWCHVSDVMQKNILRMEIDKMKQNELQM